MADSDREGNKYWDFAKDRITVRFDRHPGSTSVIVNGTLIPIVGVQIKQEKINKRVLVLEIPQEAFEIIDNSSK